MNTPNNCREFNLSMAQKGHPLVTRAGATAKFIAYVPEAEELHKVVALTQDKELLHWSEEGKCYRDDEHTYDLFLAPLGYCQGLPVFAGDVLIGILNQKFPAEIGMNNFEHYKWPSKHPVVETRMSDDDLKEAYFTYGKLECTEEDSTDYRRIANKAIERAIADGDVIPTSLFVQMACDVFNSTYTKGDYSFKDHASMVLDKYLENLKGSFQNS